MNEHNLDASNTHFERASRVIPGGVNSPVRALRSVGGTPFFAERGEGAWIVDSDGNRYVDYILSYGPMIVGHGEPSVVKSVQSAAERGLSFGAPTAGETELAELILSAVPSMDLIRLVNSGTEATMSAIRVARGFTGRDTILKFTGCYHGHADHLLVKSGSGAATFGIPDSGGVPADFAKHTVSVPFNDLNAVAEAFAANPGGFAAIILEPVAGNMGCIPPAVGFLEGLRSLCDEAGTLLIFDEVMTGFRLGWGSAQRLFNITPDLTCLGKIIGGGMPVGAYGGRRDVMECIAPLGPVYQAGTLSGNPLSVAAGIATLQLLSDETAYEALEEMSGALCEGLATAAEEAGIPLVIHRVGSMFTVFFTEGPIQDMDGTAACDMERFNQYFHGMRSRGVNLPPSQYEACFLSTAHDLEAIEHTIAAATAVFQEMAGS